MPPLHERYRPDTLDGVVGQDKAVELCRRLIDTGVGGRAVWLSGLKGTGKTTLARILARSLADPFTITEIDGSKLTSDEVDRLEQTVPFTPLWGDGWAWIVNEAHGLRANTIRRLLVTIEQLPDHATVIFTTTKAGQLSLFDDHEDAGPLLSRCVCVSLTNQGLSKVFARRAYEIAEQEHLNGQPLAWYEQLAKKHHNDLRAMLQAVEFA